MTAVINRNYQVHEVSNEGRSGLKVKPVSTYFAPDLIIKFDCPMTGINDISLQTSQIDNVSGFVSYRWSTKMVYLLWTINFANIIFDRSVFYKHSNA